VRIDNSIFERVGEFKYLGTTLTNQYCIAEEIKSRLRSGNACYHSVQNLLSSRLLSKNFKIKIYRTIILPFVLYGCETWSLTLREERKLRVLENMMLRRIFGPRRDGVTGECTYIVCMYVTCFITNIVSLIISVSRKNQHKYWKTMINIQSGPKLGIQ